MANDWDSLARETRLFNRSRAGKLFSAPCRILGSKLLERRARALPEGLRRKVKTFWGAEMLVVLPEDVSISLERYRFFEEELSSIFLTCLKPGMVVYDIGAHFGYFSLLAAHLVGTEGRVCSFEPTPSTYSILTQNTAAASNMLTVNAAVWSEARQMKFRDYGLTNAAFNSFDAVTDKMMQAAAFKEVVVNAITVDDHVAQTGLVPAFLKIDAEGAELGILNGMQKTITSHHPLITVEVGDGASGESTSRALLDYAIAHGYEPHEWHDGTIRKHRLLPRYEYDNILLMPRNSASR